MDVFEAIKCRHSVRKYLEKPLDEAVVSRLFDEVKKCNEESGLNIQFLVDEPDGFSKCLTNYGKLVGVKNYFALVGKDEDGFSQKAGYYGQKLVLLAQMLGLNTCWVALTFNKKKAKIKVEKGEKLVCVIAVGYGESQGVPHRNKSVEECALLCEDDPEWYVKGVEAAMCAPTAINQQSFYISRNGSRVKIVDTFGVYTKVDLGIVKCNFEIGAGKENFTWDE